jgi:hypothetical protein
MSEIDGIIEQYHHLVGCHLERYHRVVEETDAAEVASYMSLLVYQHLETNRYIETFMAARYQSPADIVNDARNLVERELFRSVKPCEGDLTLLVVFYAMREVDWRAVAEVIADEIADRRLRQQRSGGKELRVPRKTTIRLDVDEPEPFMK